MITTTTTLLLHYFFTFFFFLLLPTPHTNTHHGLLRAQGFAAINLQLKAQVPQAHPQPPR